MSEIEQHIKLRAEVWRTTRPELKTRQRDSYAFEAFMVGRASAPA